MFQKILIANRGEIACRIIKTARRMGIATVAVYSAADANARHVRLADEAVLIGGAEARESYLVAERILQAAIATGAQAVHPGYGFLSENAAFADACAQAGVVFIGPPAEAIRAMGSKSAAKALMEKTGVPLTPGYHGDRQEPAFLAEQAGRIGYPVLIKASAGGGGKGMRRVDAAADFEAALISCQREAINAFGNDHVLVEKYVLKPRHIEIQVFGDTLGNYVYLFERDCSVQRRHQKVVEEAPAPGMQPERRAAMGKAAVDAARAVGYVGAGTVEFIANQDGSFYFMEMNTRLQVEHPVTEMITGLDLVEWQLRVASGEPLPLAQEQLRISGHAIEARIYAEDPDKGFLPSIGHLHHLSPPQASEHVRIDTGVEQGDDITPFYDPMIAKLIVWDHDRDSALARMRQALSEYRIVGVANNIEFLGRLVSCDSFAGADLDTGLIEREHASLFLSAAALPETVALVAALAELLRESNALALASTLVNAERGSPWRVLDGWRLNGSSQRFFNFAYGETQHRVGATVVTGGWKLAIGEQQVLASARLQADGQLAVQLGDRSMKACVVATGQRRHVFLAGHSYALQCLPLLDTGGRAVEHAGGLRSPMPGKIVALLVAVGSVVEEGTPLLVMEAMKMEHTITAPARGVVKAFCCAAGEQVTDGIELVEFETEVTAAAA
ncbi:acetyl/propionyl/methylcrotonyl-CoA carboxylase subunit alpha [Herbaspirillum sp. RTI4]|uniref:acetyl/propionyl/methylcrotonyl-CoA carboxylase subunit alpha n=1 Tax=Herbaspirillum sp. RTI4 TaxID=3048640 RepID=UPI002AB51FE0|nr:acetyl/propionyl/methylcrotonyl-CoA carboxylase subunit alpha [Herbaspirillum sp. RTI4]MDY7576822.1 acetyl/propionyl/methylcrotonyl-CoA carboxylase subunit alpha [Herbaspirillum sp. RTI4]MEA9981418.1 acetyl/propionyl/methylcrotonyl-CoA carboxylase subunit alpha [Herbaspirillum sp. RTI4]